MEHLIAAIFVFVMAVASRGHGSGSTDPVTGQPTGWPSWDRIACAIIFGLAFAAGNYSLWGVLWLALLGGALSVLALSSGHGRFYAMKGANLNDPNPEKIEKYLVLPWYPGDISKPLYSWVCMGIKGLGIGLAVAPFGLVLVPLLPLAYYIAFKYTYDSAFAEWARGLLSGLAIVAAYFLA